MITTGYSHQCLLSCLLRKFFKKPFDFDFKKMLFETPQNNLNFYNFFVNILHLWLLKNIIVPQTFFKDFPQDFQSDFVTKYLSSRWLLTFG